jgi:hypothetical protein
MVQMLLSGLKDCDYEIPSISEKCLEQLLHNSQFCFFFCESNEMVKFIISDGVSDKLYGFMQQIFTLK